MQIYLRVWGFFFAVVQDILQKCQISLFASVGCLQFPLNITILLDCAMPFQLLSSDVVYGLDPGGLIWICEEHRDWGEACQNGHIGFQVLAFATMRPEIFLSSQVRNFV